MSGINKLRVKVGLALGAGAARGLAHIGVIKVLEREGIPIDFIAGTSIGSVIGAVYAAGIPIDYIEEIASHLTRKQWADLIIPRLGLLAGERVEEMVRLLTKGMNIEALPLPFAAVACDIEKGERVVLNSGPVSKAVRASIAVPGVFTPVRLDGRLLVDGGVIERVPTSVVSDMGADLVIASDVTSYRGHVKIRNIFDIIMQSIDIMEKEILRFKILDADVLIRPEVSSVNPTSFSRVSACVAAGERACEAVLPKLEKLIGKEARR